MPKKYIQMLLSINFCLTAMAVATDSDASSNDNLVRIPETSEDWEGEEDNWVPDTAPEAAQPSIEAELSTQFHHIWHRLEKISEIYPSELLQRFISEHQQHTVQYDESKLQKGLTQDITIQFTQLYRNLQALSKHEFKEALDEKSKAILGTQFMEICDCVDEIHDLYQSKKPLSKNDQLFLNHQLEELLVFSQSFLAEDSGVSLNDLENSTEELGNKTLPLAKREADSTSFVTNESSATEIELANQFNQIWDSLDKMNTIHQSKLLQRLISYHRDEKIPYDESLEEVGKQTLENQFIQLHKALEVCSQYQPEEGLDEGSKAKLGIQLDQIEHCLRTIHTVYDSKKDFLSKKEKAFLTDQLDQLHSFSYNFITENSLQERAPGRLSSLDKIQTLLDSCEEEDTLIYPQYEYIINSQETNISDLLTSSQIENNIESHFLYFNKAEGLIELEHIELLEGEDPEYYTEHTTTWKIRPADVNLVKDWKEDDSITIDKTSIFSKYTMRGESLQYTLTNNNKNNKSVRANFICKSSNQNTYTILSIDYLEKIVVLKNGPCLFVQDGDLKEWHAKDTVVLQRDGSVTDTYNSHELINKTRNKKNWVFLKRWH